MAKIEIKRRAKIEAEKLKRKLRQEIEEKETTDFKNGLEEEPRSILEEGINCHHINQDNGSNKELEEATTNILERQKRLVSDEIVPNTTIQEENTVKNNSKEEHVSNSSRLSVNLSKDSQVDDKKVSDEWSPVSDKSNGIDFTCATEVRGESKVEVVDDDMENNLLIDEYNSNDSVLPPVDSSNDEIIDDKSLIESKECITNQNSILENEELNVPNSNNLPLDPLESHSQDHDECEINEHVKQPSSNNCIENPLEEASKEEDIKDENCNNVQDLTMKVNELSLHNVPEDNINYEVNGNMRTEVIENNIISDSEESLSSESENVNSENNNNEVLLEDQEVKCKLNKAKEVIENLFAFTQKVSNNNILQGNCDHSSTNLPVVTTYCNNTPESNANTSHENNNNIEDDENKNVPSLDSVVATSDLPETVDDPDFENKIKVFSNYRNFGGMYNSKANYRKAEWAFKNAIKQATSHKPCSREQLRTILEVEIEFRINRARCLFQMGQLHEAREECQSVLSLDSHNQDVTDIIQSIN